MRSKTTFFSCVLLSLVFLFAIAASADEKSVILGIGETRSVSYTGEWSVVNCRVGFRSQNTSIVRTTTGTTQFETPNGAFTTKGTLTGVAPGSTIVEVYGVTNDVVFDTYYVTVMPYNAVLCVGGTKTINLNTTEESGFSIEQDNSNVEVVYSGLITTRVGSTTLYTYRYLIDADALGETNITFTNVSNGTSQNYKVLIQNHVFNEPVVIEEPSCTKEGKQQLTCSACGGVIIRNIPKLEHKIVIDPEVQPTCTTVGYTQGSHCSVCETVIEKQNMIPTIPHSWSEWTQKTPATCTEDEVLERMCSVGKEKETKSGEKAKGHVEEVLPGKDATCSKSGLTEGKKCSVCGAILEKQNEIPATGQHIWNAGVVTKKPTATAAGVKTFTCTVCGDTRTESIAQLAPAGDPILGSIATIGSKAKALSENGDPAGSTFNILQVKGKKVKKTSITLGWKAVPKAAGYIVYGAPCGSKYGKLKNVTGTSFKQSGLTKGKYYKYFVSAYDRNGKILASSKTIHIATSGGKKGNTKSVKLNKKKATLKIGKSVKLKATLKNGKLKVSKHRKVAYESDNPKVATVTKSGKVKAVGRGKCTIYAYAQNGVFAKCRITVK